jgi:MFS transporter, DHA1 family, tetracycline resistance protein
VFLYGLGFVLFAFASHGWMMYLFMIPFGFGGIAVPALQSIISTQVPGNEQGELQGGLTSLASLTSIIGPIVMTNLFSFFTSVQSPVHFAGAPFLLGAVLCFLGLIWTKSVFKRL